MSTTITTPAPAAEKKKFSAKFLEALGLGEPEADEELAAVQEENTKLAAQFKDAMASEQSVLQTVSDLECGLTAAAGVNVELQSQIDQLQSAANEVAEGEPIKIATESARQIAEMGVPAADAVEPDSTVTGNGDAEVLATYRALPGGDKRRAFRTANLPALDRALRAEAAAN